MNNHPLRLGNVTSSEIYRLMSNDKSGKNPGKPFYEYIQECNMERRLNLPIESDGSWAKPLTWGKIGELYVQSKAELIPMEWEQRSDEPVMHPDINYWSGTLDMKKPDETGELKCPFTRKSFCQFADEMIKYDGNNGIAVMDAIRDKHKDGEKYYWQKVSNACIHGTPYASLFVFMPYESELDAIRAIAANQPGTEISKYYWLINSHNEELPHIERGGYYKNLYSIRFEVPQADKDALTERVKLAGTLLEKREIKAAA